MKIGFLASMLQFFQRSQQKIALLYIYEIIPLNVRLFEFLEARDLKKNTIRPAFSF